LAHSLTIGEPVIGSKKNLLLKAFCWYISCLLLDRPRCMKVVVFAHTPPPHHGQSYMVQLMLSGFGGDRRAGKPGGTQPSPATGLSNPFGVQCYHVNARLSQRLEDIGDLRVGKLFLLLGYCLQAIWCRFRYGATTLYYVPAPGKRSALCRDWVVMWICRPFFKRVILHWHAAGLAKWLETRAQMRTRALTYHFMKHVDLSVVLSRYNRADAEKLFSRDVKIVSNGIPDPCSDFDRAVLPRRRARFNGRRTLAAGQQLTPAELTACESDPRVIKVLYLAHCTREKGLFDTVAGVVMANERLAAEGSPFAFHLSIAGNFLNAEEAAQFERMVTNPNRPNWAAHLGFVAGTKKEELLRDADLFCFPTFYQNENQPVNLLEAMAFGLPTLTTRWRSIPELFPRNYVGLVNVGSPSDISVTLLKLALTESGEGFRDIFLNNFTINRHLTDLAAAFASLNHRNQKQLTGPAVPVMPGN
jgi:glycosyltransferase involved in cell wall biosynthesis